MTTTGRAGAGLNVTATIELAPTTTAAHEARRFVSSFCTAAAFDEDVCRTAALLTSELVTNAVLHGRTGAVLRVENPPPLIRVSVFDGNPDLPPLGESPSLDATSGRGLHIVAALADRWGVEPRDGGKAVWFELDMPA